MHLVCFPLLSGTTFLRLTEKCCSRHRSQKRFPHLSNRQRSVGHSENTRHYFIQLPIFFCIFSITLIPKSFTQAIRYFNHVGFAMGVPFIDHLEEGAENESDFYESVEHVASVLNSGSRFYTFGMRSFYFAILYVFWYFGPISLLAASVIMIFFITLGDSSLGAMNIDTKRRSNESDQSSSVIELRKLS